MAKNTGQSTKRNLIDKSNQRMVLSIALAAFFLTFAVVASRALLEQRSYQQRIIDKKEEAVSQLESNLATVDDLKVSYQAFNETPENIIGGNPLGSGDKDGDNAKIILDALPSSYDYPALVASIEKLMEDQGFVLEDISGEDQEAQQNQEATDASQPVEMPFEMTAALGEYPNVKKFFQALQRSIRPIDVKTIELAGAQKGQSSSNINVSIEAKSYYNPARKVELKKEVVK